ncbi:MAG: sialate O-acetylesterase [Caldilinea sp.]
MNDAKRATHTLALLGVLLVFVIGAVCGVWLQRTYGVGNVLRAAGLMPDRQVDMPPPTPTRTAVGIPAEFQGRLALIVLAGQSNMSGWAPLPPEQELHPRAYLFGNDYLWRLASEPTDHPEGQVDLVSLDRGRELGTSPGLAFARKVLAAQPERVVGLIPCAKGNTTIYEWQRSLSDDTLYGSCLKRIAAASTMGQLTAILFFQGEADALDPAQAGDRVLSAYNYGDRFTQFINDLRRDLAHPNLAVVFAQIGSHEAPEAFTNWAVIQEEQAAVDMPCVAMITTDDLPLRDGVHYTTESYQTIGERFADAYVHLLSTQECE